MVSHTPLKEYVITLVPALTPETTPVLLIVATAVLLLLHVPPTMASISVVVAPVHTVVTPKIDVGVG